MKILTLLGAACLAGLMILGGASAAFAIEPNVLAIGVMSLDSASASLDPLAAGLFTAILGVGIASFHDYLPVFSIADSGGDGGLVGGGDAAGGSFVGDSTAAAQEGLQEEAEESGEDGSGDGSANVDGDGAESAQRSET